MCACDVPTPRPPLPRCDMYHVVSTNFVRAIHICFHRRIDTRRCWMAEVIVNWRLITSRVFRVACSRLGLQE